MSTRRQSRAQSILRELKNGLLHAIEKNAIARTVRRFAVTLVVMAVNAVGFSKASIP